MSTIRAGDLEGSSTIVRAGGVDQVSSRAGSCIGLSEVSLVETYIRLSTEYLRHHDPYEI